MPTIPENFDGNKFAAKYNLNPMNDFWVRGQTLFCPSHPELTDSDLLDCVVDMEMFERIQDRLAAAREAIKNHPWAGWTQQELQDWWDINLSNTIVDGFSIPATVKDMLKASNHAILREGQFLIYFRDIFIPELPEG